MAVVFNIKCKSEEETIELRSKIHLGLKGSPAYKYSELAVCDLQDDAFTLIVGNNNDHDIEFDLHSANLLQR